MGELGGWLNSSGPSFFLSLLFLPSSLCLARSRRFFSSLPITKARYIFLLTIDTLICMLAFLSCLGRERKGKTDARCVKEGGFLRKSSSQSFSLVYKTSWLRGFQQGRGGPKGYDVPFPLFLVPFPLPLPLCSLPQKCCRFRLWFNSGVG